MVDDTRARRALIAAAIAGTVITALAIAYSDAGVLMSLYAGSFSAFVVAFGVYFFSTPSE